MFHIGNPEYLYGLLIVPILILVFIFTQASKKKAFERFGEHKIISNLMPLVSRRRPVLKFAIKLLVLALVIFAIARPQFGSKLREVKTEGVEIVIALDVSNSMMAEDIIPNRLEAAKRSISRMLDNLQNDKIGLIIFAGKAFVQVPITTDYTSIKMFLSNISTKSVREQGTAIGEAIKLSMKSFSPDIEAKKALIIITDGENHEEDPIQAAKDAKEKGILVYTIGLGDKDGKPIPVAGSNDYRKSRDGTVILTKLNESTLMQIANAADGKYIRASNSKIGLSILYDEIDKMDKTEMESIIYSEYEDVFQYVIFLAILLLFIDFMILSRKNKQLEKVKIFNLRS